MKKLLRLAALALALGTFGLRPRAVAAARSRSTASGPHGHTRDDEGHYGLDNLRWRTPGRLSNFAVVLALMLTASAYAAQRLSVKIVDRQINDTNHTYVVPGALFTESNSNANCFGTGNSVNCSGSTTTTGSVVPPRQVSFSVRGATFSLQLPDGRVAVVNCESKFVEHFAGPQGNRRSCRMPLVNDIQVEFDGDKAKLIWPVSIDGKKLESETYKILAVLDKR